MNKDIFEGKWKQVKGQVREWWGDLTDNDVEMVGGHMDKLVGILQERYGYTRERAENEINRRLDEFETRASPATDRPATTPTTPTTKR